MTEKTILVNSFLEASKQNFDIENLPVHALPGLHDHILYQLTKMIPEKSSILELGAGSGAFSKRLYDLGHKITAVDYTQENFRLHGTIPFIKLDLNECFSNSFTERYDCIVAIEIIEHIENPRNFMRECKKLLTPNGLLIFSTPNVDSPSSKDAFLRNGLFSWFSDASYIDNGHITPLTQWYIKNIINENKYTIQLGSSFGSPGRIKLIKKIWLYFIEKLSRTPVHMNGDILVYFLRG
jgi:2-polyprenyl-3-methyl-5-hydroxy-6-metoxy-1,4-benzoquinol methylase